MATAEFSKFADILSAALSQHHLSGLKMLNWNSITSTSFHHSVPCLCRCCHPEQPCSPFFAWQAPTHSQMQPSWCFPYEAISAAWTGCSTAPVPTSVTLFLRGRGGAGRQGGRGRGARARAAGRAPAVTWAREGGRERAFFGIAFLLDWNEN